MKEVLIYGALVAAILGVSTTLMTQMRNDFQQASGTIQTNVTNAVQDVVDASNP